MNPTENLHYAIGEIVYALAAADGEVQKEERLKLKEIVSEEVSKHHFDFDITSIIFQTLDKQGQGSKESYEWGMNQMRVNSHYLSPELKTACISIMEKVAAAFPIVTNEERSLIERFRAEIAPLKGDPIYYKK
jgi:uncharacterized tellurite resistance protein B-like protein